MAAGSQDITDFKNNNVFDHAILPPMLVDEVSDIEYYVGHSKNTNKRGVGNWRIRRIWKVGSVWNFGFPDGNQDFVWNWDLRDTYDYQA